jgi:hypothetical protein
MMHRATATIPTPGHRGPAASAIRRALLLGALLAGLLYLAVEPAPAQAAVWVREDSGTPVDLTAVSCTRALAPVCKAGGSLTTIVAYDGIRWSVESNPRGNVIWDLDCVTPAFCKATDSDRILSYDGTSWRDDRAPVGFGGVAGVACVSAGFCRAVGSRGVDDLGTIWSWNGSEWSLNSIGSIERLHGVTCPSTSFCKAVGKDGTIVSYDGMRWRAEASGTTKSLWRVSCVSPTFCKAIGTDGTILSYDGRAWSSDPSYWRGLRGVSCVSTSFCKAVGEGGAILTYVGNAEWREDSSGTTELLGDVSCLSTTICKAVGLKGTILSLAPASATVTREHPVEVACRGTGQSCDVPFELPLRPSAVLRVRFDTSPEQCSDIRVTLSVVNRLELPLVGTQVMTLVSSTSPFMAHGGSTEELALDRLPSLPGDTVLRVTAEGREGGCNTGRLERFGGTLIVISSP